MHIWVATKKKVTRYNSMRRTKLGSDWKKGENFMKINIVQHIGALMVQIIICI